MAAGIITGFKAFTAKSATKVANFSKNKLPAPVHNAGSKGVNWVKENPMYATAGAGVAGVAAGSIIA